MIGAAFAAPLALALLATLPVILWLHLRRRRARPVRVPALAPWLALRGATPPSRRHVPRSLLLWLRLGVALCLALAAAQPLGGAAAGTADRVVLLDVSTSMAANGVWPVARARADAWLASARRSAGLVTLGPRPRVVAPPGAGAGAARRALAELQPGGTGAALDEALALARAVAPPGAELVIVTDGRLPAPATEAADLRWDVVEAAATGVATDNAAIVAAGVRPAGAAQRLFARVVNFGSAPTRRWLTVTADGAPLDRQPIDLPARGSHEAVWSLPAGARRAELRLEGSDALPADDAVVLPIRAGGRRLQLAGRSPAAERALAALPETALERVGEATFHTDGSVDASVFLSAVPQKPPPGGVLIVHPPASSVLGVTDELGPVTVDTLGDHPLGRGLDLSGLTLPDVPTVDLPAWASPVLVADGRVLAYAGRWEDSPTLVLLVDPDAGGIDRRLAFPLLVARAIEAVSGPPPAAVVPAGAAVRSPPGPGWRLVLPDGRTRAAAGAADDTGQPGLYDFAADRPPPSDWRFGVLAGDATESDLSAPPRRGGAAPPGPAAGLAGLPWWPLLAAAALGLILLELALRVVAAPGHSRPGGAA